MRAKFINEAIKHLGGRVKDEIDKSMKGYSIYDKFFECVKYGLDDVLKQIVKTDEFKNLDPKLQRQGLVNACFYGNLGIVKILLDNGFSATWVNLDWVPADIKPIIKEYRKKEIQEKKIKRLQRSMRDKIRNKYVRK